MVRFLAHYVSPSFFLCIKEVILYLASRFDVSPFTLCVPRAGRRRDGSLAVRAVASPCAAAAGVAAVFLSHRAWQWLRVPRPRQQPGRLIVLLFLAPSLYDPAAAVIPRGVCAKLDVRGP